MTSSQTELTATSGLPFQLIHTHPRFFVISKAERVNFHREGEEQGLFDLLRAQLGEPLHAVHRLDKPTSGLILLARDAETASQLSQAFAEHQIEKYYLALVARPPKKKQGWIIGDMAAARNGCWKLLPDRTNPAITQFFSYGLGDGRRLMLVRPRTGRTHQIRVALKSLGAPIIGDNQYGGSAADRCYLHAWTLKFNLAGESFTFSHPPESGEYFCTYEVRNVLAQIGPPDQLPWPRR
ncbi:TIGR01621 family pseudouridine synthase [Parachitinimonas caeni]|uniref:TIGR01621 family pseudouridine synthase n=1 Tax=Parachitinimonas caeni TaxID=3031301 RepID=A0ABT7DXT2_9NEIS|nr:TIGR01621 family pseudouridine synthase [Parachitinimonas caeni]MDK2124878.1 TIGR01621 family pseudouridine synthase [Parachitinimonas caeni]